MSQNLQVSGNHVLIGLGGTGGKILKAFKMRMFEEFPDAAERDKLPVTLLYVDSTTEMMPVDGKARADFRVMGQDASFTQSEFLNIKDVDVDHILNHISNYPPIRGIVENAEAVRTAIGSLGKAAGQKRRAGRLLFAANILGYVNSLKNAVARCESISGQADNTYIYIFTGLAGGTGSGAIIDAINQARKAFPSAKILVYAMVPELHLPKADMNQGRYYPNGYAALNELNALQAGRWVPQDVTGNGARKLFNAVTKGVANGLTLYSNVNENGLTVNSLVELPKLVSDYVFARIFYINDESESASDVVRAQSFENNDEFALEFDETARPDERGKIPAARTKLINSFGLKRVMYPELRVLKHITYTIGEDILYQFKFNNWQENRGYINDERNKDYRREYLNKDALANWKLDKEHLTLDKKILDTDLDYPSFNDFWHDKVLFYADDAKKEKDPLNVLDDMLTDVYKLHFRDEGVEKYFESKERVIPEMVREIRQKIEHNLFDKWKDGDVSIVELQRVSKLLLEKISEIREDIDKQILEENENLKAIDEDRKANVREWSNLSLMARMVGNGSRRFSEHQNILTDYYVAKTTLMGLEFAKKLAAKLFVEMGKMDADISAFGQKISEAIDETERLVTAQAKVNKGLEDMRGAIIEVSEDEAMTTFEVELKADKTEMPVIARQIREWILPQRDFTDFGTLATEINVDDIKDAFDVKLTEIVRTKHEEKVKPEKKVLGLNILTQLQQKLKTDDEIRAFAHKIVTQSGIYLKLNNDQMQLHLRNNEGPLSPSNPASINKKAILVSIPSPDDNESLKRFADKLERAFKESFNQSTARTTLHIDKKSPRKDELTILTVGYCFPMRAITWLQDYKMRYEDFLNTGNAATDASNAILLHSEGDGKDLPSLFAQEVEEVLPFNPGPTNPGGEELETPLGPTLTPMPPIPQPDPEVSVFLAINGKQDGPYDFAGLRQKVKDGFLKEDTFVWMQGLSAWTPAKDVEVLKSLFLPMMPPPIPGVPGMPPLPPM